MGIVRRQSIFTSILSYLGIGLGYVNVVLLFPAFFEPEEFGLTRVIVAIVAIGSQVALLGFANTVIKYFPRFREGDEKYHHGLLGLSLLIGFIGTAITSGGLLIFKPWIVEHYQTNSPLVVDYYWLILPLLLFEVCFQLFTSYTRALHYSVVNVFFREVFIRISTALLIIFYSIDLVDFSVFMQLFVGQFAVASLGMAGYLLWRGSFHLRLQPSYLSLSLKKEMSEYSGYAMVARISNFALNNVDIIMIGAMLGLKHTAYYSVAFYIAAIMTIPRNAIANISVPLVSGAWERKDYGLIQKLYSQSSLNQLLIGLLLFLLVWVNQETIFQLLPDAYAEGASILFFAGLIRLVDMAFGLNNGIINTSENYRFETYLGILLILIAVGTNLLMIPILGAVGAALASLISYSVANVARYFFLKWKHGFDPFSWKLVLIIVIGVISYLVAAFVPTPGNWMVTVVIRTGVLLILFVPTVLIFRISEEVNDFLKTLLKRFKKN